MDRQDLSGNGATAGADDALEFRYRYDWSETLPSVAVVETLSQLADSPLDVTGTSRATLTDYVDPDALDALVASADHGSVSIAVTIECFEVTVVDDEVAVFRPDDRTRSE